MGATIVRIIQLCTRPNDATETNKPSQWLSSRYKKWTQEIHLGDYTGQWPSGFFFFFFLFFLISPVKKTLELGTYLQKLGENEPHGGFFNIVSTF